MRPTTSGSKLTNPFNFARLLYVLGPFIPDVISWGRTQPKKLARMHETAVWYCEKPHVVSGLEQKLLYHQNLREELEDADVQGKTYVLLPGMSADNTAKREGLFPGKTGLDILHEHCRLGNEIERTVRSLYENTGADKKRFNEAMREIVFLQATDMILPVICTTEGLEHLIPEAINQTNTALEMEGKRTLGSPKKEYGFSQARNDYSDTLLESETAHRIYEPKYAQLIEKVLDGQEISDGAMRRLLDLFSRKETEEQYIQKNEKNKRTEDAGKKGGWQLGEKRDFETNIGKLLDADEEKIKSKVTKVIAYNLQITANAYATYFAMTHPKEIIPFIKKTSYAHRLLERVSRIHNARITEPGKKGVMKNAEKSLYGECDPAALRILEGFLMGELERRLGKKARKTAYLPTREYQKPANKRQIITAKGISIQTTGESSAERYLANDFTIKDVEEMLKKIGERKDPKKTYEELRFTDEEIKCLQEDVKNERYVLPGSIHHDLEELSSGKDFLVFLINNENCYLTRSWMAMHTTPKVSGLPTKDAHARDYQMRASEFSATCHIARVLSKMDTKKLGVDDKNNFSIVGTATHRLWNNRPWADYPEKGDGPHCMEFCEKKLSYTRVIDGEEVTILGSADGIATVESKSGDYLMILDRKRANYYKQAFTFQTMTYNQAVMQMMQETLLAAMSIKEFKGYFTVINKRPFVSVIDEPVMPHMVIGYASKNAAEEVRLKEVSAKDMKVRWVRGLEEVLRNNLNVQRKLVNEKGAIQRYKQETQKKGRCEFGEGAYCLNMKKCNALLEKLKEGYRFEDLFLVGVRV